MTSSHPPHTGSRLARQPRDEISRDHAATARIHEMVAGRIRAEQTTSGLADLRRRRHRSRTRRLHHFPLFRFRFHCVRQQSVNLVN